MKTIFISSFHPFISRNILYTPVISHILRERKDAQIVILVPDYKKEYFVKCFAGKRIAIEGVRTGGAPKFRTLFFKRMARMMLDTDTARIQKRSKLHIEGGLFYFLVSYIAVGFGKFRLFRSVLRFLDYWFADFERFNEALFRWKPDLIVATDVQNEYNVSLMQAARYYNIPAVAMVRSWDNLTSLQGMMRVAPKLLLVPTAQLKKEAILYHDIPEDYIRVVGIPHYDRYRGGVKIAREEFFNSMGLDPEKKLILYTTLGDRYLGTASVDQAVLEVLKHIDVNIVVRCHPGDTITLEHSFKTPATMIFDRPGVIFKQGNFGNREISADDDKKLEHELFYADVVVLCASTIAIDAAVFGAPAIGVAFSGTPASYWASPRRFYGYTHLKRVVKTGGIRLVGSKEELRREVDAYLRDPARDKKEREHMICQEDGFCDAESSERVARIITQEVL
ncbi:MAG: hypothetical protein HYT37_00895 [Candidatus Sungbacteria bacterium]|nr:hypothetical protein [Candidatus Sungbacteria bacterium]